MSRLRKVGPPFNFLTFKPKLCLQTLKINSQIFTNNLQNFNSVLKLKFKHGGQLHTQPILSTI